MEQPMEINMNDPRFQSMIGKSKKVMAETDARFPDKTRNNQPQQQNYAPQYQEREPPMPQMPQRNPNQQLDPNSPEYKMRLENSNLPAAVKQALMESPGNEQPMMMEAPQRQFSAQELGYNQPQMNEQPTPQPQHYPPQGHQPQYNPAPQQPSVSRDEIKGIIKEVLAEMMVSTISENTIKTTIRTLINEGKIKPKRKAPQK